MNIVPAAVAALMAGLPVSLEAQSISDGVFRLNPPDAFEGMKRNADLIVSANEAGRKAPSIEIGDISLHDGIKVRNIRLYGSSDPYDLSDPLPGLDQALAGCDGNQAKGWVSYSAVTINCSQGGVETERTLPLPPSTQTASSLVEESRGTGSKMLIAKNQHTARLVVDSSMLTATSKILTTMQFGSPFANTSYAIGNIRQVKDNDGKDRWFVDLCLVDEKDLNQPATDGNSSSKKGGTRFPFKCGSSKNQNSDSDDGEFPEEGDDSQSSGGGSGGNGGGPDKNNADNKPETVMLLSVEVNRELLIKALKRLINSATQEQRIAIKGYLAQITNTDIQETKLSDQDLAELMVMVLKTSEEHLQSSNNNAEKIQDALKMILRSINSGISIEAILVLLHDFGAADKLEELQFEDVDLAQDDEAPSGATAANAESPIQISNKVLKNWKQILSSFLEIEIKEESNEPATDDQIPPEDQANSEEPETEAPEANTETEDTTTASVPDNEEQSEELQEDETRIKTKEPEEEITGDTTTPDGNGDSAKTTIWNADT